MEFRKVVWGWGWGGERCKLLLPGGERGEGIAVQSGPGGGREGSGKGVECEMRGGENAHHKRGTELTQRGNKCYGKFPNSRSLNNREFWN